MPRDLARAEPGRSDPDHSAAFQGHPQPARQIEAAASRITTSRSRQQVGDHLVSGSVHVATGPAFPSPEDEEHLGQKRPAEPDEISAPKDDRPVRLPAAGPAKHVRCRLGKDASHRASLAAKPDQRLARSWIGPGLAARQDLVPEKVAGPGGVGIGEIFLPSLADRLEKGPHQLPRQLQERTQERNAVGEDPTPWHPGQTGRSGTPQDVVEDRLCLIIGRVGNQNLAAANVVGSLSQEGIPLPAGTRLDSLTPWPLGNPEPTGDAGEAKTLGHPLHELPVGGRLSPQIMLGMGDHQPATGGKSQLHQTEQQGHAVSPAGNSDNHGERTGISRQPVRKACQKLLDGRCIAASGGDGGD